MPKEEIYVRAVMKHEIDPTERVRPIYGAMQAELRRAGSAMAQPGGQQRSEAEARSRGPQRRRGGRRRKRPVEAQRRRGAGTEEGAVERDLRKRSEGAEGAVEKRPVEAQRRRAAGAALLGVGLLLRNAEDVAVGLDDGAEPMLRVLRLQRHGRSAGIEAVVHEAAVFVSAHDVAVLIFHKEIDVKVLPLLEHGLRGIDRVIRDAGEGLVALSGLQEGDGSGVDVRHFCDAAVFAGI